MISEPIATADGSFTLRHPILGETYHARDGARSEAQHKFILPSGLAQRLLSGPIRLLDIGFGLGVNCRSALETALAVCGHALHIDTLELEPEALERALSLAPEDPLCLDLQRSGFHQVGEHQVRLHLGDARSLLQTLSGPWDFIFHDPFSPMKNTECWTQDFFTLLRSKIHTSGKLLTYSESKIVRAGLSAAGWQVASTPAIPPQRGGTVATPADKPFATETLPWRDPEFRDIGKTIRARRELAIRGNVC